MSIGISYMGTKHRLASKVRKVVDTLPDGPMLDVFAGMCAVGEAVAPSRLVWTNDVQPFPALVAKTLFCSASLPPVRILSDERFQSDVQRNLRSLADRFRSHLEKEKKYLASGTLRDIVLGNVDLPHVGANQNLERQRKQLTYRRRTFPYRLATITYAGAFFGVTQSMEIDSIRYAIDEAWSRSAIDTDQHGWLLIALGRAASKVNNSTGQFAQYLRPSRNNLPRYLQQRRRSVWSEFSLALGLLAPLGNTAWRRKNRSFSMDAVTLLKRIKHSDKRPKIIYADPPYTAAQYSRYYHVLDTLVSYNYPVSEGMGRYPSGRFQTPFSNAGTVENAMNEVVEQAALAGAAFLLSYPRNGLLHAQGCEPLTLLRKYYKNARLVSEQHALHSTFGGRAVASKVSVQECIYLALDPKAS